jgi:hypothetical protein
MKPIARLTTPPALLGRATTPTAEREATDGLHVRGILTAMGIFPQEAGTVLARTGSLKDRPGFVRALYAASRPVAILAETDQ